MNDYEKFIELCDTMPSFVRSFFVSKSDNYQPKTKLGYATDFNNFLFWILKYSGKTNAESIASITCKDLESLSYEDIDLYLNYLSIYPAVDNKGNTIKDKTGKIKYITNSPTGKARKLAAVRMLYKFLLKRGLITFNPTELTETPKEKEEKAIFTLSMEQQSTMLNRAYRAEGRPVKKEGVTERGLKKSGTMRQKTRYRDYAILATLFSSGIRVSELCNINIYDIDFNEQMFIIKRKGGSTDHVYFGKEAKDAMLDYIELERNNLAGYTKESERYDKFASSDGPLFITGYEKGTDELKRITPRRVQQIVKEYGVFVAAENEKITPHTLRKTFGTSLFREYKDLILVQHALGHSDSSTTSKYYVGFDQDSLKVIKNRN